MVLDTRIALGVQPLDVGSAIGRGYQLRDLAVQADTRRLDNEAKQRAQQKQATLGDLYRGSIGTDGKIDRAKLSQGVAQAGYGADLPEMQKQWSDQDRSEAEYLTKNREGIIKTLDYSNKAFGALLAKPNVTANDVISEISAMTQFGIMTPEQGAQAARSIPGDPAQLRPFLQQKLMQAQQAKDMYTAAMPQLQAINLGGTTQLVDTNAITNPQAVGQTLQRTATPGEQEAARHNLAAERNMVRGQDMTDQRARDLNQTKVEENRLKREVKQDAEKQARAGQLASFDTMLGTLGRLAEHPGLSRSVGISGVFPTVPGSNSANFQAELETFKSQAFIPMVSQLKGMGALSDAEGKKLSAAVGALDPKMGEAAFRQSVARIMEDMAAARARLENQQGGGAQAAAGGGVLSPQPQAAQTPQAQRTQQRPSQMLDFARQSIAQGADRAVVIERLRSMGIDPGGL